MNPPEIAALSLFGVCFVSGVVVPIPEDVAILSAGWAVTEGRMGLGSAFLAAFAGTLLRDAVAFALGRFAGTRLLPAAERVFGTAWLDAARDRFARAGSRTIFLTRFAVGMRAPLYFVGGSLRFPMRRFLVLDAVGLTITTPLLLWIGADRGPVAADWIVAVLPHQRLVVGVGVALALTWLGYRWHRRRSAAGE